MMTFNKRMVVNVNQYIDQDPDETLIDKLAARIGSMFGLNRDSSYNSESLSTNPDSVTVNEDSSVDKKKMQSLMKNMGMDTKDVENMDEESMYNAMMDFSKSKKKGDDKEKEKEKGDKVEKKNAEEVPAWG